MLLTRGSRNHLDDLSSISNISSRHVESHAGDEMHRDNNGTVNDIYYDDFPIPKTVRTPSSGDDSSPLPGVFIVPTAATKEQPAPPSTPCCSRYPPAFRALVAVCLVALLVATGVAVFAVTTRDSSSSSSASNAITLDDLPLTSAPRAAPDVFEVDEPTSAVIVRETSAPSIATARVESTPSPTSFPTRAPVITEHPTSSTSFPTRAPVITEHPTPSTSSPTTVRPSSGPSFNPTTSRPSSGPSFNPTTSRPTSGPSYFPTTSRPTLAPSSAPSGAMASPTSPGAPTPDGTIVVIITQAPAVAPDEDDDVEDDEEGGGGGGNMNMNMNMDDDRRKGRRGRKLQRNIPPPARIAARGQP